MVAAHSARARAGRHIDFAFEHTPPTEVVEIGFFGGEPLLEFELIREITRRIEAHAAYSRERVHLTIVTNGTLFNAGIAAFVNDHDIAFGISCDGPADVQDSHRRTRTGHGSSRLVERTIRNAVAAIPAVMVNAVYRPDTLRLLPATVAYLRCVRPARLLHELVWLLQLFRDGHVRPSRTIPLCLGTGFHSNCVRRPDATRACRGVV